MGYSFKDILKRTVATLAIPVIALLIMIIVCSSIGVPMFERVTHYQVLFGYTAITVLVAFALSINLNSGRFDFSIGSIMLLSAAIGYQVCQKIEFTPMAMLIVSIVVGAILGLISGIIYVTLKLPPIITSLGITLIYEAAAYFVTNNEKLSFTSEQAFKDFNGSIPTMIIIIGIATIFMIVTFHYTKFGFDYKALISGQKIGVKTGINEISNAIICYTISGALLGAAGMISDSATYQITTSLNFGSIGTMFTAFLPMFIGGFIARFSNEKIGIMLGAFTYQIFQVGFGRIAGVVPNFSADVYGIINSLILVVFLIYLNNEKHIVEFVSLKKLLGNRKEKL